MNLPPQTSGPPVPDWTSLELPDAWPDRIPLSNPLNFVKFIRLLVFGKRQRVKLPAGLPGAERIPKYVLLEFHNLPNGNFSKSISRGYAKGFDRVMLGLLHQARARLAKALQPATRAVDLGCGAGHMAGALVAAGSEQVWGLDPSPYLLQYGAERYPMVRFLHGVAESLEFENGSLDAVSACFLFHELPPGYADQALREVHRVLRPGGRLGLLEPSEIQRTASAWQLWRRYGWRGLYFAAVARFMFEPFLDAWHRRDVPAWFIANGFRIVDDQDSCPYRMIVVERR